MFLPFHRMRPTCLLILLSLCLSLTTLGQSNDILVMKERKRTIRSWVKGDLIHFQFVTNQWIDGRIERIGNDSIFLNYYITRELVNGFGFPVFDTAWMGPFSLHVSEIKGMPARWQHTSAFTNGALLQLGAGGYMFLNIFNSLNNGEPVFGSSNLTRLGVASGVFLAGKLQEWNHRPYVRIRKKYSMRILSTSVNK